MTRNLLSTFCAFVSLWLNSYAQITFQKTFNATNYIKGHDILQTIDGGYIIGGESGLGGSFANFCLIKLDSIGNQIWTQSYNSGADDVECFSINKTNDSGYIMIGVTLPNYDFAYLVKTNLFGDTLWTRVFSGGGNVNASVSSIDGFSIIQSPDGGYLFTGSIWDTVNWKDDIFLAKLDSTGNLLWSKGFGFDDGCFANSIIQCSDGTFALLGNYHHLGNTEIFVLKVDSLGGLIGGTGYSGLFYAVANSILQTKDNGFLITGLYQENGNTSSGLVFRIDSIGNIIWSKRIGGTYRENFVDAAICFDSSFILTGFSQSFTDSLGDVYLVKIDSAGSVLWSKNYGGVSQDYVWSVNQTMDSGYVFGGWTNGLSQLGPPEGYIIKTDKLGNSGCNEINVNSNDSIINLVVSTPLINVYVPGTIQINPNTTLSIMGTGVNVCSSVGILDNNQHSTPIYIHPNPTSSFFKITNAGESEVTLFNVIGNRVYNRFVKSDEETIYCENLPPGIYFVQVQSKYGTSVQKLIKQ